MVSKRPLQIFNGFWGDHHHWMFFGSLTIAINGFSMVFHFSTIAFSGFRWFQTIGQTMRWFRWIVVVYWRHISCKWGKCWWPWRWWRGGLALQTSQAESRNANCCMCHHRTFQDTQLLQLKRRKMKKTLVIKKPFVLLNPTNQFQVRRRQFHFFSCDGKFLNVFKWFEVVFVRPKSAHCLALSVTH